MYGKRNEGISTSPTQLGITSGTATNIISNTPESKVGGELEIVPDVYTPRIKDYAIWIRFKDKDGNEKAQPYNDKFGRQMRWRPSLEEWGPYQKMQKEREQKEQDEISRGKDIRGFKAKHRALMSSTSVCMMSDLNVRKIIFHGVMNNANLPHTQRIQ